MPLIRANRDLYSEISAEMRSRNLAPVDVSCVGARFPWYWDHLGAARVAPYACKFADRHLLIIADVTIYDADGDGYARQSPAALKYALRFKERNLKWAWSNTPTSSFGKQ